MASDSKSRDILWQELNAFRNNPAATEEIVKLHQRYYSKRLLFSPDWPAKAISTQEGDTPIWSLIEELKGKTVIGKIMPNESLNLWADELAKAYKKCYEINIPFTAEEGKKVKERLKFSVQHFTKVTCLIGLGFSQKNQPLMTLLVNDGDCERKNRRVLFDPRFTEGGIGRIELGHLLCGVYLLTTSVDTIQKQQESQSNDNSLTKNR